MANRYISKLFNSGAEFEAFLQVLENYRKGVASGEIVVPNAKKASQDAEGNVIADTYAKINDLTDGTGTVKKASHASTATNATTAEKAKAIITISGTPLKFFVGTQSEYDALLEAERENLFAIISDDATKETLEKAIQSLTQNLSNLKTDLTSGEFEVKKATSATSATTATSAKGAEKATKDAEGNYIHLTYAKKSDLIDGKTTVKYATEATKATKATQDDQGNNIANTYAQKNSIMDGSLVAGKATNLTHLYLCTIQVRMDVYNRLNTSEVIGTLMLKFNITKPTNSFPNSASEAIKALIFAKGGTEDKYFYDGIYIPTGEFAVEPIVYYQYNIENEGYYYFTIDTPVRGLVACFKEYTVEMHHVQLY